MQSTRTEEQKMTAELVAVKIKKKDFIRKRKRGGEGRELREGCNERKSEKSLGTRRGRKENILRRELAEK